MSEPIKIIIEVSGGLVQAVYSPMITPGVLDVVVYDHDNIKAGDEPPEGCEEWMKSKWQVY